MSEIVTCDSCGAEMELKSKVGFGAYWECPLCGHNLQTQRQATAAADPLKNYLVELARYSNGTRPDKPSPPCKTR